MAERNLFERQPMVRVLEADPDLGDGLSGRSAQEARARLVARVLTFDTGPWKPEEGIDATQGDLGVLVLEGLLTRDVVIAQTKCAELVGKGDLLRPWEHLGLIAAMPSDVEWHVLQPTSVAVLDRRFVRLASDWPEITSALVLRAIARAQSLAVALAITCVTGLPLRVLVLLWYLADRWGVVLPEGVVVPLRLTHELIARLVGARRPSVTTALSDLEREGRLKKRPDGGWLLLGEPPQETGPLYERRALAR